MAKIFLDTNILIDAIHRKPEEAILESLIDQIIYISPLSIHIYCYSFKINIPKSDVLEQIEKFQFVDFSADLITRALQGPTSDFEDNVQLHSAAISGCDMFITNDKKLLAMKYFGKVKIINA